METLWLVLVIGGPLLLAVAIIWSRLNNKRSAREEARTEAATRRLYEQESRDPINGEG